jgi:hypothetical protein
MLRPCLSTINPFSLTPPTRDKAQADICQCKESGTRSAQVQIRGGHVEDLLLSTPLWYSTVHGFTVRRTRSRARHVAAHDSDYSDVLPLTDARHRCVHAQLIPRRRSIVDHTRPVARSVYYVIRSLGRRHVSKRRIPSSSLLASPLYRFW